MMTRRQGRQEPRPGGFLSRPTLGEVRWWPWSNLLSTVAPMSPEDAPSLDIEIVRAAKDVLLVVAAGLVGFLSSRWLYRKERDHRRKERLAEAYAEWITSMSALDQARIARIMINAQGGVDDPGWQVAANAVWETSCREALAQRRLELLERDPAFRRRITQIVESLPTPPTDRPSPGAASWRNYLERVMDPQQGSNWPPLNDALESLMEDLRRTRHLW